MKQEKYVLTEEQFDNLWKRTSGYSVSNIATLRQDAIYELIRKCESITHFIKINKNGKEYYIPCSLSALGVIQIKIHDMANPEILLLPDVCYEDYILALKNLNLLVSEKDLKKTRRVYYGIWVKRLRLNI